MAKAKNKKNWEELNEEDIKTNIFNNFKITRKFKLSEKQTLMVKAILRDDVKCVLCSGLAGTGKSAIAVYSGLQLLKEGKMEELVYVRSPKQTMFEEIGFTPGDVIDKMNPYNEVLYDKLNEFLSKTDYKNLFDKGVIKTMPTSFIRGYDLKHSYIIVDEAQNLSLNTIYTLLTRVSEGSKIIFIADPTQKDIPDDKSGFSTVINVLNDEESVKHGIEVFEFNEIEDIKRSELVKYIIQKFQKFI